MKLLSLCLGLIFSLNVHADPFNPQNKPVGERPAMILMQDPALGQETAEAYCGLWAVSEQEYKACIPAFQKMEAAWIQQNRPSTYTKLSCWFQMRLCEVEAEAVAATWIYHTPAGALAGTNAQSSTLRDCQTEVRQGVNSNCPYSTK